MFLCTIIASLTLAQNNQLQLLAGVSQGVVDLSRNTQCLADKGDSAEIIAKVYHTFDDTVAGVKKNVDGPLTQEKFGSIVQVLVIDTAKSLKSIHIPCNGYCPQDNAEFSHAPKEIGDLGKELEAMGLTMSCLLDDPKPEILAQFPVILGAAMQSVAHNDDTSKTSVAILLHEIKAIVKGLQKLSSRCVHIKRMC